MNSFIYSIKNKNAKIPMYVFYRISTLEKHTEESWTYDLLESSARITKNSKSKTELRSRNTNNNSLCEFYFNFQALYIVSDGSACTLYGLAYN